MKEALADKYVVDREIGRGGAAKIFVARTLDGSPVALKVLHPQLAVSVTAERFLREIAFLERIDHPRISRLLDYGESEYLVYYVMEYVNGPTLREHMTRNESVAVPDAITIARELLEALQYAHSLEIVHRDVKPENIVLSPKGATLLDFGIARAVAQSGTDRLTRSGFSVGTSTYMSPEQIEGRDDLDQRSDLYSLGCVMFECLAGQPPFSASHEDMVMQMHLETDRPDISDSRQDLPVAIVRWIAKAMEHDRTQRWQTAAEMSAALEGLSLA